ncbi:hypothetical protein KKA66_02045 [Patescibacteria group bacterium]|nr:hypothetical protein [Patescibacteria group bacterium]
MNIKHLKDILKQAKTHFKDNEQYLFSTEVNERSMTHKFAEYLQTIIGCSWNVDCEYNRYGNKSKKIDEIKNIVGKNTTTYELKPKTVFPDIIIHKRGKNGKNLLVIEAKKDPTTKEKINDIDKLKKIQKQYNYTFAVFMKFNIGDKDIEYEFVK